MVGYGYTGTPYQGYDCTLSGDGNSLIVDASQANSGVGGAFVFTRSANSTQWTQNQYIQPVGGVGNAEFGESVAINSNGTSCFIGAPYDTSDFGAFYQTY